MEGGEIEGEMMAMAMAVEMEMGGVIYIAW